VWFQRILSFLWTVWRINNSSKIQSGGPKRGCRRCWNPIGRSAARRGGTIRYTPYYIPYCCAPGETSAESPIISSSYTFFFWSYFHTSDENFLGLSRHDVTAIFAAHRPHTDTLSSSITNVFWAPKGGVRVPAVPQTIKANGRKHVQALPSEDSVCSIFRRNFRPDAAMIGNTWYILLLDHIQGFHSSYRSLLNVWYNKRYVHIRSQLLPWLVWISYCSWCRIWLMLYVI